MQCTSTFSPAAYASSAAARSARVSAPVLSRRRAAVHRAPRWPLARRRRVQRHVRRRGAPMKATHSSSGTCLGAPGTALTLWYWNVLRYKFWQSGTVCAAQRAA